MFPSRFPSFPILILASTGRSTSYTAVHVAKRATLSLSDVACGSRSGSLMGNLLGDGLVYIYFFFIYLHLYDIAYMIYMCTMFRGHFEDRII